MRTGVVIVGDVARTGAPVPVAVVHTIADPVPPPTAICDVVPLVDTPVPPAPTGSADVSAEARFAPDGVARKVPTFAPGVMPAHVVKSAS